MGIDATMLLKVKGSYTEEQTLTLARRAFECFGESILWVNRESKRHCIEIVTKFLQDGDTIYKRKGETLLEVHVRGRYYGIDYERGHLPDYIMLAEYFELSVPNVEVWYGGDSSGVVAYKFDRDVRNILFNHFVANGHSPYEEYFDHEKDGEICDLCNIQLIRNGWGGNYKQWYCKGCGKQVVERNGIKSIIKE